MRAHILIDQFGVALAWCDAGRLRGLNIAQNSQKTMLLPQDPGAQISLRETLATSTILISFNWPRGTDRYRRLEKFVDAFFTKFDELRKPLRHPAWRDVNMFATIRGWQRFPAAQQWIDRTAKTAVRSNVAPAAPARLKAADQELFQEFLRSRQQNR